MSNIPTSYKYSDAFGVPAFAVLDTYTQQNLLAGAEPPLRPANRVLLADSLTLAQFTVVGLTAAGKLTPAVYNATLASATVPIGVLVHAATSGATNTTIFGEVWLSGCFNAGIDDTGADSPLIWDASFTTLALKTQWVGLIGKPGLVFRSGRGGNAS